MDTDLKNLKKLVAFCRKNGVLNLKSGGTEISLAPAAMDLDGGKHKTKDQPIETDQKYTEEQMLFWSAPGMDPREGLQ